MVPIACMFHFYLSPVIVELQSDGLLDTENTEDGPHGVSASPYSVHPFACELYPWVACADAAWLEFGIALDSCAGAVVCRGLSCSRSPRKQLAITTAIESWY